MRPRYRTNGFTLVELLVVIAIIAVLVGLLLPAVQKVREAASYTKCSNNLRQLAFACVNYDMTHRALPPATIGDPKKNYTGYATWAVLVLPYIEQGNLYSQWSLADKYTSSNNKDMVKNRLPIFF